MSKKSLNDNFRKKFNHNKSGDDLRYNWEE